MIYHNLPALSPQTVSDYLQNEFDFWDLLPQGDALVSAVVSSDMVGMVLSNAVVSPTNVTCWVTGGIAGNTATITCEATSSGGSLWYRSATMAVLASPVISNGSNTLSVITTVTGPPGPAGAIGPAGANAVLNNATVIAALGYTPLNTNCILFDVTDGGTVIIPPNTATVILNTATSLANGLSIVLPTVTTAQTIDFIWAGAGGSASVSWPGATFVITGDDPGAQGTVQGNTWLLKWIQPLDGWMHYNAQNGAFS